MRFQVRSPRALLQSISSPPVLSKKQPTISVNAGIAEHSIGESAEFEVEACDAQGHLALASDLAPPTETGCAGAHVEARHGNLPSRSRRPVVRWRAHVSATAIGGERGLCAGRGGGKARARSKRVSTAF
jgi:hypothetical protein